jgi:hypothetical protein
MFLRRCKVVFDLSPDDWHGYASESMWCERIPLLKVVMLANAPFFVKGVSNRDLVSTTRCASGIKFRRIVKKSGHATLRIRATGSECLVSAAQERLEALSKIGCQMELAELNGARLWAVDVPLSVDDAAVMSVIRAGAGDGVWDAEIGDPAGRLRY